MINTEQIKTEIDLTKYNFICEQFGNIDLSNSYFDNWHIGQISDLNNHIYNALFISTKFCWYEQINYQLNNFKETIKNKYGLYVVFYDHDMEAYLIDGNNWNSFVNNCSLQKPIQDKIKHELNKQNIYVSYYLYNSSKNTLFLFTDINDCYSKNRKLKTIENHLAKFLNKKYNIYKFEIRSTYEKPTQKSIKRNNKIKTIIYNFE